MRGPWHMHAAGFTPEPWFWALDKNDRPTSLMRAGTGDYVVCPQADVGDYGLSVNPWIDVSEADARLIASAPDLYEALKDMREGWRYIRQHHGDLYGVGWDRCEASADAALSKAEARS